MAVLFIVAIGCASAEATRPSEQPGAPKDSIATSMAASATRTPASTAIPADTATQESTATDPRAPSNFTPEQIAAATERANCLKDQGLDPELVRSLARGEITAITPELVAASNACGFQQTIFTEPQTDNPTRLSLTVEQTLCIYGSLDPEVVAEIAAGGNPVVGAYDPFLAFHECGIDINEILAER